MCCLTKYWPFCTILNMGLISTECFVHIYLHLLMFHLTGDILVSSIADSQKETIKRTLVRLHQLCAN